VRPADRPDAAPAPKVRKGLATTRIGQAGASAGPRGPGRFPSFCDERFRTLPFADFAAAPISSLRLHFVHGYRGYDARDNARYLSESESTKIVDEGEFVRRSLPGMMRRLFFAFYGLNSCTFDCLCGSHVHAATIVFHAASAGIVMDLAKHKQVRPPRSFLLFCVCL
jgi:hypothetical protein